MPIKSKTTAGILAILLGGLGIHKFYLGNILWGFIYLIFCRTWIPEILGVIEGIIYLTTNDDKWNERYNNGKDSNGKDYYDDLLKYDKLRERGLISQKEYEGKIKEIRSKINKSKKKIKKYENISELNS